MRSYGSVEIENADIDNNGLGEPCVGRGPNSAARLRDREDRG